jgi:hypothetical protein
MVIDVVEKNNYRFWVLLKRLQSGHWCSAINSSPFVYVDWTILQDLNIYKKKGVQDFISLL